MINRFKIIKDSKSNGFYIWDRFKRLTFLTDKRYSNILFPSKEAAQGFIYGRPTQNIRWSKESIHVT